MSAEAAAAPPPPRPGLPSATARAIKAFPTLLRVGISEVVAYRAEFVVWILTTNMPLVMLAIWRAVAADGPVGRFDQRAFTAYYRQARATSGQMIGGQRFHGVTFSGTRSRSDFCAM